MKPTYAMDINEALDPQADDMTAAFAQCISEIDRHLEEIRREQESIRSTGERTDATLTEISEILAELKAA